MASMHACHLPSACVCCDSYLHKKLNKATRNPASQPPIRSLQRGVCFWRQKRGGIRQSHINITRNTPLHTTLKTVLKYFCKRSMPRRSHRNLTVFRSLVTATLDCMINCYTCLTLATCFQLH